VPHLVIMTDGHTPTRGDAFLDAGFIREPEQLAWWVPLTPRPVPPPVRPSVPVSRDIEVGRSGPPPLPAIPEAPRAAVAVSQGNGDLTKRRGGLSVHLDINVERRRSFWWRLALSLVVRLSR
jgi:hypothetical protein